jgi:hypothetical protein
VFPKETSPSISDVDELRSIARTLRGWAELAKKSNRVPGAARPFKKNNTPHAKIILVKAGNTVSSLCL